jgi:CheY-like chemotaxis protein
MKPENAPMVMLVVEDNPGDVILLQESMREMGESVTMTVLTNGLSATEYLRRIVESGGAGMPDVVILDLNLPIMTGHEVLREIAAEPMLKDLAVAVLTTSTNEEHVCQEIFNCLYLVKPSGFAEMIDIVRRIMDFAGYAEGQSPEGDAI